MLERCAEAVKSQCLAPLAAWEQEVEAIKSEPETQFAGMAFTPFSYTDYEATRERLVQAIRQSWTDIRPH